jgi:hypothetical protein
MGTDAYGTLRRSITSVLKREKRPMTADEITTALIAGNGKKEDPDLRTRVFVCLCTYPEFPSTYEGYVVAGKQVLSDLQDMDPKRLEALMVAQESARHKQPAPSPAHYAPHLAKKPKSLKERPQGLRLEDEVFAVIREGGKLTRDQVVSAVLQRGNIKRFDRIGSVIGFYLNTDPRYKLFGIYYSLNETKP